ncbi:MAG TPA: SDR family NAD(P)-dependent oxidoreductase [Acidimicrobiales bacterium]|jgi:NAD(P)-dependent dehydrogenase (short-subunit alcohol dehydrogenase family)|nr:SDR family NAD(P)-dependent oxidoreductase [Acidimicrobiales bacterium]
MGRLEGKVAIVTGGASGLGLATVERFVAEGARVVLTDLPPADHPPSRRPGGVHDGHSIAERLGAAARFVPADVTVAAELEQVFAAALDEFGGLDVLFNNAGIGSVEGSVAECPEDLFDRIVDVDLKAMWRGIKLASPVLAERGGGSIICTGSIAGMLGAPGMGSYSAAKGGVISLTRVAAMELAPAGVRVNCICPGAIVTPIIYESGALTAPMQPDDLRRTLAHAQPLPRSGEPADVANLALFLASDESSFITGQSIAIDGGLVAETDARNRTRPPGEALGVT